MVRRLAIIGVGLIGGSLARALRAADSVGEIIGCGRDEAQLERAVELGIIDRYSTDPAEAVDGADGVVIGTPVGAMESILEAIRPHLADGAIITDVGSTKGSVVAAAHRVFGVRCPPGFVPGHPIAGTERNGVEASFAELFQHRRVILTPLPESDTGATAAVRAMWEKTGAMVETMTPQHHDEVFAATSHLPHLLAYTLVNTLATLDEKAEIFRYAAGGFRDFTRIASSNPSMWHDICLANRDALLKVMNRFEGDLHQMRQAIESGDGDYLLEVFTRAKEARDCFVDKADDS
ncbi:prephenate dehydrogenase [Thiohalomonas denitrificans]|uniref:prephenate dehydrogenase n=1 Tax=Thiohalomonas denitrificans TaxID=415747 RepID=UPI0026F35E87|nr:prephenate dehydrogenase/arogenate dehydrogenase family protein [Thiohalomonas denitrificans]